MKKIIIFIFGLITFHLSIGQQSENYLLGKVYTKSTNETTSDNLNFNNRTSGVMEGVSIINGKEYIVSANFSYTISGNDLQIIYQNKLGTEKYFINKSTDELLSTHLEGNVNGKWGKIIYKRKVGAGNPGQVEGANYAWNKVPAAQNNQIRIGSQVWMEKNLDVDKFQNGDVIAEAKTKEEWLKFLTEKKAAWCYYENDSENGKKYGKLYNWYAVNDTRKLAPTGWHIPTSEEWDELTVKNLGSNGSIYARPGYDMKSREGWTQSNNSPGDFGNTSGFSAIPAGFRQNDCLFNGINNYAVWWSSTKSNVGSWNRGVAYNAPTVNHFAFLDQSAGLSVRLIQDNSFSKRTELVFVLVAAELKYELKLLTDASNTASLKIYKNQVLNNTINGNWKIETGSDGIDNIFMTYMTQTSGGYESSYGVKKFTFKCSYDNSKEIKYVYEPTHPNDWWYNINNYDSQNRDQIVNKIVEEPIVRNSKVIGTPIKIGDLEIAQYDFPTKMNFENAKKACSELGAGWRLPTKKELNTIYENKDKIGVFSNGFYWSSSSYLFTIDFWVQEFKNGKKGVCISNQDEYYIRTVRSL